MGLFSFFTQEIAMDLGTANTLIIHNDDIVVNEPSIVALNRNNPKEVLAVGKKALLMHEKTHESIRTVRPLKDGVIADFNAAELMIRELIKLVYPKKPLFPPSWRMVICIPSSITEVEKRAVRDSAEQAGAKEVYMIHEPMAAALGIGIDVEEPVGNMIIDIGGGTTGITVIALAGIVCDQSIRVAGDEFTADIMEALRRYHSLLIGERTAEQIKIHVGAALKDLDNPPDDMPFGAFIFGNAQAQTTVTVGSTTLDVRNVITGIDIPWEIIWGPDEHIWFTERVGRISRLNPETGVRTVVLNLTSSVYQSSESGMLGMALHPDFENTPHVFVAYTYSAGINNIRERFVRYEYNGTALINPLTLVENIAGTSTHNGSRMLILPDTTLLISTGDAQQASTLPQSLNSLNGKFLRMNLDGSIPADNPFGPSSYVYTYGHRNPQGILLAPNGKLYSSEHGPSTNDEFNIIEAGKNYGWPLIEGLLQPIGRADQL
jgi:MreB/Mrl family cell shape determining protein